MGISVACGAGDNRTEASNSNIENASPYADFPVGRDGRFHHSARAGLRAGPVAATCEKGNRKRPGLLRRHAGSVTEAGQQALGDVAGRTTAAKPEGGTAADVVAWRRAQPARAVR